MENNPTIRPISIADNAAIARIIRAALLEHGAARPGTVYFDESTDSLSEGFSAGKSIYYIIEQDGVILGGAGIYPTLGLGNGVCELVKMYLTPAVRGKGLGRQLITKCVEFAIMNGYKQIYLETMPELARAINLYERYGFRRLYTPLGRSGHFGCDIWMMRDI